MPALVLRDPAVTLATDTSYFVLRSRGKAFHRIAPAKINLVLLFDGVEATRKALDRLALTGIPVTFLHENGSVKARLAPLWKADATARLAQISHHIQEDRRQDLARKCVMARLANAATGLLRDFSKRPGVMTTVIHLDKVVSRLGQDLKPDVAARLIVEADADYYALLGALMPESFTFKVRSRRPPCDAGNALLSYSAAAMAQHLHAYVEALALDPYVGYLYAEQTGRPNLCLDLLEPFLPVLADRFALSLLHQRRILPEHFERPTPGHPATRLNPEGRLAFLTAFAAWADTGDAWYVPRHYMSPELMLVQEVERFENAARTGKLMEFEPFVLPR